MPAALTTKISTRDDPVTARPKVSDLYEVRQGDIDRDMDDVLRLWRYLPGDTPPQREKLDWFYRDNPAGRGLIYFLDYKPEGKPVGVVCLGPREFSIGGQLTTGTVFGDFAIEPEHRSLGPALMFQKAFLELATQQFSIVYGFPNALSGKVRSFGGHKLGYNLNIFVLPMDFRPYLKRRLSTWVANVLGLAANFATRIVYPVRALLKTRGHRVVEYSDEFMNRLWQRLSSSDQQLGTRDAEFVHWRFTRSPNFQFETLALVNRDGVPAAFAALRTSEDQVTVVEDAVATDALAYEALVAFLTKRFAGRTRALRFTISEQRGHAEQILAAYWFRKRGSFSAFATLGTNAPVDTDVDRVDLSFVDNDV